MSTQTRFNDIKQQESKDLITIVGFITLIFIVYAIINS